MAPQMLKEARSGVIGYVGRIQRGSRAFGATPAGQRSDQQRMPSTLQRSNASDGLYGLKGDLAARTLPVSVLSADLSPPLSENPYLTSSLKRVLDIVLATTTLLLLLPLLIMVAVAIRATSPGPILFQQTRCGFKGRPFTIFKFRSMVVHEAVGTGLVQASRNDSRVTSIGRFIRRTSIDELPQLLNVLRGDMSLIGPRPHATCHDELYQVQIGNYGRRFAAKPGLSGLAQVSGSRGATPLVGDMERRIGFDLVYIQTASFRQDMNIIGATLREMMFSSEAY